MRKLRVFLATLVMLGMMCMHSNHANAGDAVVSWTFPTAYEDGSPLPIAEIESVKVVYGTVSGTYTASVVVPAPATTTTISNLAKGTWFFAATVTATNKLESALSVQVSKNVLGNSKPKAPVVR